MHVKEHNISMLDHRMEYGGRSLHESSAHKIPKWTGMLALIPLKGSLSAWPFCENHFQKKTQITHLGMAEHLRDPPEC